MKKTLVLSAVLILGVLGAACPEPAANNANNGNKANTPAVNNTTAPPAVNNTMAPVNNTTTAPANNANKANNTMDKKDDKKDDAKKP